jgi:hypothetical protein
MTNTSMATKYVFFDHCCDGKLFKDSVHSAEKGILIINVFFKFGSAFISEAHTAIDLPILMSSSQKDKILWKFNLQSKQKKYCFYAF